MSQNHTPGPWGDNDKTIYVRGATWLGSVNWEDAEALANARLIKAAPDLLEALRDVVEELRMIRMKDVGTVYDVLCRIKADAAIAKAEGLK